MHVHDLCQSEAAGTVLQHSGRSAIFPDLLGMVLNGFNCPRLMVVMRRCRALWTFENNGLSDACLRLA
jgi:hypothetical protein